jgi:hypothetical protein
MDRDERQGFKKGKTPRVRNRQLRELLAVNVRALSHMILRRGRWCSSVDSAAEE